MSVSKSEVKHTPEDGGPAFAQHPYYPYDERDFSGFLSLRDWFAGQALAGFTSVSLGDGEPVMGAAGTAKAAYNYADAMLRARAEGRQP
jgi:hypothetical protein